MSLETLVLVIFFSAVALIGHIESHGAMKVPMARAALWEDSNFPTQPVNWNYGEVWCGNVHQDLQYSTCGRCGDPLGGTDMNNGGLYGKGFIAKNYTAGSIIEVVAHFHYAHYGSFEIELCANKNETDDCFKKLPIVRGSLHIKHKIHEHGICVPFDGFSRWVTAFVQLPKGVRCSRCTLRWTYRTSYKTSEPDWDPCFDPKPAQTFRNCADIAIF